MKSDLLLDGVGARRARDGEATERACSMTDRPLEVLAFEEFQHRNDLPFKHDYKQP
jgi:hypothetical protein